MEYDGAAGGNMGEGMVAILGALGEDCTLSGERTAKEKRSISRPFCLLLPHLEPFPVRHPYESNSVMETGCIAHKA